MNISLYISELLKDYDEISLSDVGTFYKERTSAFFNESTGLFHAPSERICFKTTFNGQDDTLVHYISQVKKISEASSRYFINKFITQIQQSLSSFNEVEIQPIGLLKNSPSGLVLAQTTDSITNYGLTELKEFPFKVFIPLDKEVFEAQPSDQDSDHTISKTWKVVFIILVLLIISGSYFYIINPSIFNLTSDKPIPEQNAQSQIKKQETPAVIQNADSSMKDADSLKQNTTDVQDSSSAALKTQLKPENGKNNISVSTINKVPTLKSKEFYVIGASFGLPLEAKNYIKTLQKRGIKATIVEDTRRPKYKISLGSFHTYEEANIEKRQVQSNFNKEAWILNLNDKAKK
ncbi:SPOR domain-containing protein [Arcticibacter eurypsychrophilus]|uniref:SPOR domain-containing protein n=1 Tax=Arcticibacter eurypsychrophilus TaxID=1434752 RepID=UPI00084CFB83|nr:SPOR domain-containing protein [Arcticibacter eurypsychrophilus]